MGKLAEAARSVDNAWCKFTLVEDSGKPGEKHCALGAMGKALLPEGMKFGSDMEYFDTPEKIEAIENFKFKGSDDDTIKEFYAKMDSVTHTTYWLADQEETKVLAEVIKANYRDRVDISTLTPVDELTADRVVFYFNDHSDTTRDEVVAMMEKADLLMEDRAVAAEDRTVDELLEDISDLVDA